MSAPDSPPVPLPSTGFYSVLPPGTDARYLLLAGGLLLLYGLPYIWLGEGAYLTVHDNLDSDFLYLYLLKVTHTAFNTDLTTVIPNVMNGIPRSAFRSGLNLEVVSFYLLPPYVAQVVNFLTVHFIGLIGMYLLVRRYVLPAPEQGFARVAIAFLFAVVPGYIVHGASVSGQPLVLFAFLNVLNRRARPTDWAIIIVFPFYSFLVWAGLFIAVALGLIGGVRMGQQHRLNWPYIGALGLLTGLYLVSEWELIYGFLNQTYISHRIEFDYSRIHSMRLTATLSRTAGLFMTPMFNTGAFWTGIILLATAMAARQAYRRGAADRLRWLIGLPAGAGVICLVHGCYHYLVVWLGDSALGEKFRVFQFDRFYFLLPALWFILFALALRELGVNGRLSRLFLLAQLVVMGIANDEWRINAGKLAGLVSEADYPSYRAFFAQKQFAKIREYIARPQSDYRVVCVGMPPSAAQFNGFYTLDSYQNNYPLAYKHAFRRIIAAELAKGTPAMRTYYDAYGCRAYIYSAELGMDFMIGKTRPVAINTLQIDTPALAALGGRYVLSAVPIRNAAQIHLRLKRVFDEPASYWRIWLYEVKNG